MNRREFLSLCGVMASSFASCTSYSSRTRVAAAFLADPPLEDYAPIIRNVIGVILPLESGSFPLTEDQVFSRLLSMFPIEDEQRFLGLQKTLVFFDRLDLFPHTSGPLLAQERIALDVPIRMTDASFRTLAREKIRREEAAFGTFSDGLRPDAVEFRTLSLPEKRGYYDLWNRSEFTIKREFARSMRTLILVATYSDDRSWPSIDYSGTTLQRPEYQKVNDAKN